MKRNVENVLEEILKLNKVLETVISSYEGLVILEKGLRSVNRKKLIVEIAKIAKGIKTHLSAQLKEGVVLSIYYEKYELLISFLENFIITALCDKNVNMGVLKIKMRDIIPKIKDSL